MSRFSEIFVSKDRAYFDLFEEAAANTATAAGNLSTMLAEYPNRKDLVEAIHAAEAEGDRITHELITRLNNTFVTPIERDDIIDLASGLDDITDLIDEVADYLGIYKIERPMVQAKQLAEILHEASEQIRKAMPRLRDFKDMDRYTTEIHRLENEGDRVVRNGLKELFSGEMDALTVIRWKDLFDRLEEAVDACERVANVLNGIVIRNG